ncbi:MAG: hypothetical protein ACQESR_29995 [Planctomycetota bacterium]
MRAAILDHMNIDEEAWLDTVQGYDEFFCYVVDSCASMGESAANRMEACQLKQAAACSNSRDPPPRSANA